MAAARRFRTIYLVGEHRLVSEFADACRAADYGVLYRMNDRKRQLKLPSKQFRYSLAVPRNVLCAIELTNTDPLEKRKNIQSLDRALGASTIVLTSSVTVTATEQSGWMRHPERLVGIGAFPTLLGNTLIEFASGNLTDRIVLSRAQEFFLTLGKQVSVVHDRIGMIMPRILCGLANEALFAVGESVASPSDIDTAMKLGTNYPFGPVEWANRIGFDQVLAVLDALLKDVGEDRYRAAPLLRQLASAGSMKARIST